MKTNGEKKTFDAVKTMREIRDQLSAEIMGMTFAEEKEYLKKLTAGTKRRASKKPVRN